MMDSRCPRKLKNMPDTPCEEGRKAVDASRNGKEAGCPWSVADQESCYCVWKYLDQEGRPTDAAKTARLAMINETEIKTIEAKFKKLAQEILDS